MPGSKLSRRAGAPTRGARFVGAAFRRWVREVSLRYPIVLAATASLLSLASSIALAQAVPTATEENRQSGDGKSPDDWRFAATIYGWAVNLNGSATARGNTVDINASVIDLLQKSNSLIGFMGDFEA